MVRDRTRQDRMSGSHSTSVQFSSVQVVEVVSYHIILYRFVSSPFTSGQVQ